MGRRPGSAGGRARTPWTAVALAVIAALALAFGLITIAGLASPDGGPLAATSGNPPSQAPAATIAIAATAATALVALVLYRLMALHRGL